MRPRCAVEPSSELDRRTVDPQWYSGEPWAAAQGVPGISIYGSGQLAEEGAGEVVVTPTLAGSVSGGFRRAPGRRAGEKWTRGGGRVESVHGSELCLSHSRSREGTGGPQRSGGPGAGDRRASVRPPTLRVGRAGGRRRRSGP